MRDKLRLEKILSYFNPEDAQAVQTQVQSRMDSSQQKLLINLLDAAADKAFQDAQDEFEAEEFSPAMMN